MFPNVRNGLGTGRAQFVPRNELEEVVLVLLVGEAMAARDAVLSQSRDFEAARAHALRNAVAVADLLALAAARWRLLAPLIEVPPPITGGPNSVVQKKNILQRAILSSFTLKL